MDRWMFGKGHTRLRVLRRSWREFLSKQQGSFPNPIGILPLLLPRGNTTALYLEKNVRNGRWGQHYVILVDNLFPFGLMGDFDWVEEKKRVMPLPEGGR